MMREKFVTDENPYKSPETTETVYSEITQQQRNTRELLKGLGMTIGSGVAGAVLTSTAIMLTYSYKGDAIREIVKEKEALLVILSCMGSLLGAAMGAGWGMLKRANKVTEALEQLRAQKSDVE